MPFLRLNRSLSFLKSDSTDSQQAVVVTTNYDRLPDYAADGIEASSVTGFEGAYIKKLELPNSSITTKRVRARERVVEIWKVHGSLDWFTDAKERFSSFHFYKRYLLAVHH